MRDTKTEKIQRIVEKKTTVIKCDICGVRGRTKHNDDSCEVDWNTYPLDPYIQESTVIQLKNSEVFPEGGDEDYTFFDICPACFRDKLVPWMKSLGVKPQDKEESW